MMKKAGFLIEKIAEMSNLELAWYKAKRGKCAKASVLAFEKDLRENLKQLQTQLLSYSPTIGDYHYFTVFDPKKRIICAAPFPQRVLHHALMNVCHPFFERRQIYHSYASRIGKGTYAALQQAAINSKRFTYYLKMDVRKYFDTIHHGEMRHQLCSMFKDPGLLQIFDAILDSYEVESGRGVPIGNLSSQYFANHYLSAADHFALESLRVPAYVRYMDDMVIWHSDKNKLIQVGNQFMDFIKSKLHQTLKTPCLNYVHAGLPFLGYLVYPDTIRLAKRSRLRYIKKIKMYYDLLKQGEWNQRQFQHHAEPLTAFTYFADAKAFRQKVHATAGMDT
jgi:RNA-directed DNA polymerase